MKNIPAKHIQRIILLIAMLFGLNLIVTNAYAQDANASVKIQLLSEALQAREAGELLVAKAKVERIIELAPEDENMQALLISLNQSIEDAGLVVYDDQQNSYYKDEAGVNITVGKQQRTNKPLFENSKNQGLLPAEEVSPLYLDQKYTVDDLILIANSQIAAGDLAGATATLIEIEARDPNSKEAKLLALELTRAIDRIQSLNVYQTRENMLNAVNNNWEQPKVFEFKRDLKSDDEEVPSLLLKLENIVLPKINFTGMALTRVIEALSELSVEFDSEGQGVNIVPLFDSSKFNPNVTITLRNTSLDKVLQFVTQQVDFTYEVDGSVVTIQPSDSVGGNATTITEVFPINRASVIQITGLSDQSVDSNNSNDYYGEGGSVGITREEERVALLKFFQQSGVNFDGVDGATLAFDGDNLIITQTPRNIKRLQAVMANYNNVKQVEIEAKFLEVSQNDLDELGFNWGIGQMNDDATANSPATQDWKVSSTLRSLNDFGDSGSSTEARIFKDDIQDTLEENPVMISAPSIGKSLGYGSATPLFSDRLFTIDNVDIDLEIQALSRKTGSDLMSAPKVTVLSGKSAQIKVAQELIYPTSYGEIESTVSSGGGAGSSSAVSITAGTPEAFDMRPVGVMMDVTPRVANNNTISLELNPRVTEFEGFVEYGGPSIALSGDTTAIVPAGFYQPIFSTREIKTEVTIYDGATVVMGGLTRDEIRSVNDKVPFLGDIPGLGRLFRSEGETRQKKNLLIFVTANLVNTGGSLTNQSYDNIKSNTIYQSPAIATPAGGNFRNIKVKD